MYRNILPLLFALIPSISLSFSTYHVRLGFSALGKTVGWPWGGGSNLVRLNWWLLGRLCLQLCGMKLDSTQCVLSLYVAFCCVFFEALVALLSPPGTNWLHSNIVVKCMKCVLTLSPPLAPELSISLVSQDPPGSEVWGHSKRGGSSSLRGFWWGLFMDRILGSHRFISVQFVNHRVTSAPCRFRASYRLSTPKMLTWWKHQRSTPCRNRGTGAKE